MLYTLLLDRHRISVKNNWFDDNGEVYIYFKRDDMESQLGLSDKTVVKAVQELKNHLLLEEKQQGMNRPNKIYLMSPVIGENEKPDPYLDPEPDYDSEKNDDETATTPPLETECFLPRTRNSSDAGDGISPTPDTEEFRPSDNELNDNNKNNNELSDTAAANSEKTETKLPAAAAAEFPKTANLTIPYSQILDMYNEVCETTGLRPIRSINGKRKDQTAARFKEYGFGGFVDLFEKITASDFLCGGGSRGWKADFDWLTAPTNMQKVLEGKYDNNQINTPFQQTQFFEPHQSAGYTNTNPKKNTQERNDPFLERAMTAYATAAQTITAHTPTN